MAQGDVNVNVNVDDKGTLKRLDKDAARAARSTNRLGQATEDTNKKRNRFNRLEKGTAGITSNSTKAFAKQAQTMGGTLVPAYATLAANIFAISAAFGVLQRAAQLKILEEGFERLANTSGRTSSLVVADLQRISNGALSAGDAMRAAAAGFSAGFSQSEIGQLTEIAKNASIALGRSLPDAVDRLIRGVGKLEPEILDELGIFVRLDTAARNYAFALGKPVGQLTELERRQAFLNETLTQGALKFAAVSDIDTNPFDKLAASFDKLQKTLTSAFATTLTPIISLLSNNVTALLSVLVLFGSTVATKMLPALNQLGQSAKDEAAAGFRLAKKEAKAAKKEISSASTAFKKSNQMKGDSKFSKIQEKLIRKEKVSIAELQEAKASLMDSEAKRSRNLKKYSGEELKRKQKELALIRQQIIATEKLEAAERGGLRSQERAASAKRRAQKESRLGKGIEGISAAGPLEGFKKGKELFDEYNDGLDKSLGKLPKFISANSKLGKILQGLPNFFRLAGVGARIFGAALINAIPAIGQLLFVAGLAIEGIVKLYQKMAGASEAQKALNTVIDTASDKIKQLGDSNAKLEGKFFAVFQAQQLQRIETGLAGEALGEAIVKANEKARSMAELASEVAAFNNTISVSAGILGEFSDSLATVLGEEATSVSFFDRIKSAIITVASSFVFLVATIKEKFVKLIEDLLNKVFPKLGEWLEKIGNTIKKIPGFGDIGEDLLAFGGSIKEGFKGGVKSAQETLDEFLKFASDASANITGYLARALGQDEQSLENVKRSNVIDTAQEKLNKLLKETEDLPLIKALVEKAFSGTSIEDFVNGLGEAELTAEQVATAIAQRFSSIARDTATLDEQNKNLSKTFETIQKATQKFLDRAKKTDPLMDLAKGFRDIGKELNSYKKNLTDTANSEEIYASQIENLFNQNQSLFESLGVTKEAIMEGGEGFLKMADTVEKAALEITRLKGVIETAKADLVDLKESFELRTAQIQLDRLRDSFKKYGATTAPLSERLKQIAEDTNRAIELAKKEGEIKDKIINAEIDLKQEVLNIELALLRVQYADNTEAQKKLNLIQEEINGLEAVREARLAANESATKAAEGQAESAGETKLINAIKEVTNLAGLGIGDDIFQQFQDIGSAIGAATEKELDSFVVKLGLANQAAKPFLETLMKLGPEGEVVAAVTKGAFQIAAAFNQAFTRIDAIFQNIITRLTADGQDLPETFRGFWEAATPEEKLQMGAAATAAIANSIGALSNIMSQASQQRVAELDAEIEAEKKRDGKSAESVAKIKALEKKKEQEKRKAFEQDKKMKMAQTVMNTASAIMNIWGGPMGSIIPLAIAMTAMVSALGAAQLAVISGMSYQGGGSSGGGSGVSSVSVGSRNNSVDLARSTSPAGELAYMRGEQGQGTSASNFVPGGFAGKKYRAFGGNTGFMVGEQGPEMFVPNRPGTVIPADDVAFERNDAPMAVNFSINTIDSQGVEDFLMRNRGQLIESIRQAANSQGEFFLEDVDTFDLTQQRFDYSGEG